MRQAFHRSTIVPFLGPKKWMPTLILVCAPWLSTARADTPLVVDLSLLVSSEYPCTWPHEAFPFFQMNHYRQIGPISAYNSDILIIDPNTASQIDVPPHSIARAGSSLPNANRFGDMFADKVPAWQYGGEACVVDCRFLLDEAPNGVSPLITKELVMAWEKKHRPLGAGDVVLFFSGYSDKYYQAFPKGRRFISEPLEKKAPGWPDPDPECMDYLGRRQVAHVGTDSPSMGPIPVLAEPTHIAGLKHGMIFTEGATHLDKLPTTGAFYCMTGPRHAHARGSEGRAFAIVDRTLSPWLIEATRNKRVVDLSVVLAENLPLTWPGRGVGNHRHAYFRATFFYNPDLDLSLQTHMLDSHAGTHLIPPSYALPADGFDNSKYSPEIGQWLNEYQNKYGARGTSNVTTEGVELNRTCGWARVIDVRHCVGSTGKDSWPASPEITVAHIQAYEKEHGALQPGEIVLFRSEHVDRTYRPHSTACLIDPVNGKREGWPAPGPEAILYLATREIRCVGTDGPTLGGVDPQSALATYWALGTHGMVGVEFLQNLGKLPAKAYFIFAPVKIDGCHGGPGRALAYY